MKPYLALIGNDLRLALRDRSVIFFNYLFPLVFFFGFGSLFHAERSTGAATLVVTSVLVIGVLGNGLFGAGIRSVVDREAGVLRRFKVAPISPLPLLAASLVTGLLLYLPSLILMIGLARGIWKMPLPDRPISLLILLSVGVLAFRAVGLIIAAVANSVAESNILVQLLYMPMMFLSGATVPIAVLPPVVQRLAAFVPAYYLVNGVQGILQRGESLLSNLGPLAALLLTLVVATFVARQLFRWEKEQVIRPAGKLLVAAALLPFAALGVYDARTQSQQTRTHALYRVAMRQGSMLIRGGRIFVGDGRVIESGAVLVRNGKIEEVYEGAGPDPALLKAEAVEAAGKTVLPGLIDVHIHLGSPGGVYADPKEYGSSNVMPRALAQYLYAGVTTVKSVGDALDPSLEVRDRIARGEILGAELFVSGPMFTAAGGHGTEYAQYLPESLRASFEAQIAPTPKSAEEARRQVMELKAVRIDGLKAILEAGFPGRLFERLDSSILKAIGDEARAQQLPLVVHTGNSRDVADALDAGASGIEHGPRDRLTDELLRRLKQSNTAYDPTLSVWDAQAQFAAGHQELLDRTLVQQTVSPNVLTPTRKMLRERASKSDCSGGSDAQPCLDPAAMRRIFEQGVENLRLAYQNGVTLVTGSDAGNPLVFHGPTIQRELQLWVAAGIPATVALQAATWNAARLLRADSRLGLVAKGHDADLLIVDGNPLTDITAAERISLVVFKGERVRRAALFTETQNTTD
jgi:imidazolonepropionase-like amidohydrolase/ABC-type multidrug transport system permease subunit